MSRWKKDRTQKLLTEDPPHQNQTEENVLAKEDKMLLKSILESDTHPATDLVQNTVIPTSFSEEPLSIETISHEAREKQGTIGTFSENEEDRISDNFFTVDLSSGAKENVPAYLEYDLFGLASHESVPRSVNRNIAVGGEIIVPNTSWTHQREEISSALLHTGVNTVMFSSPSAGIKYKVKNLKITFGKNHKTGNHFNISTILSGDKLYIKGNNISSGNVIINTEQVATQNGEFEKTITLSEKDKAAGTFTLSSGGVTEAFKIPAETRSFKISADNYATAKSIDILKDKEYSFTYENLGVAIEKESTEAAAVQFLKLRTKDFPSTSNGVKNITPEVSAYRFSVVSGKLNKKVKLTIPYDEKRLGLVSPKDIKTFYFDYNKKQWIVEKSAVVDTKTKTVTIESSGDNDYINGIISVPESPQTNAFAPTSISGLKAGDPTSAVQFVKPPSASQKGDANVSYPIVIPSGRKGMQPSLSVAYSSSNGNGWLGEGWDVSGLSSITIDTRWGSPVFSPSDETELYSLNGEMLVYDGSYLPHRHNDIDETSGIYTTNKQKRTDNFANNKKVFFLRRNHDFTKIERYGSSPANYRWVVTGTDGMKTYYGGDENGVDAQSVITNPAGNIVHWGIWKVEDPNKNNIKYVYDNVSPGGFSGDNANLNGGRVFHIKSIIYTGYDGANGLYSVDFERETSVTRQDISINAKQGVKRIEPYKLNKIYVRYNGQLIRSYQMNYTTGQFYKTLLQSIQELDQNGGIASRHDLEYYDDLKTTGANFTADKDVNASIADAFPYLPASLTPSKIQANSSFEWGINGRIPGVGISILWPTQNPFGHFQVSGLFGFTKAEAKNAQNLIDFDGDGIQDIVYRKPSDGLYVSSGSLANGNLTFTSPKKIINLQSNFSFTTTKTDNKGIDFGAKIFGIGYNRSLVWSVSRSTTPVYMTDANSDGLMDVVKDGEVWFNKLSGGTPEMTKYSDQTENMVLVADAVVEHHEPEPEEELPPSKINVLKVWVAPKGGYIKITDNVSIENVANAKALYSIEIQDNFALGADIVRNGRLYMKTLTAGMPVQNITINRVNDYFNDIQALPPTNPNNHWGMNKSDRVWIGEGAKLYFRLHKEPEKNFKVFSDPKVVYVDQNTGQELPNNPADEQDGFYLNNSGSYSQNFLLNNRANFANFDAPGSVTVTVPAITFPKITDVIKFKVVKIDVNTDTESIVYSDTYQPSTIPVTIPGYTLNYTVNAGEPMRLKFVVESDSHTLFKDSNWNNIDIKYVATANNTTNTVNFKGVAQYPTFEWTQRYPKPDVNGFQSIFPGVHTFGISINKDGQANADFYYIVKKGDQVLAKRRVKNQPNSPYISEYDMLNNNQLINGYMPINYHTGDPQQLVPADQRISIIIYTETQEQYLSAIMFTGRGSGTAGPFRFFVDNSITQYSTNTTFILRRGITTKTPLYHNWGQILYDENNDVVPGTTANTYVLNPQTPSDNYGRLINIKTVENINVPSLNGVNYPACQNLPTQQEIAQCIANQINQPNSPYQTGAFNLDPVIPMTTKKLNNVEKWVGLGPEQYSMADSFKNDQETTDLFDPNGGNPDMPDTVVQGQVDTKMYAIDKKHYSRAKTTTDSGSFIVVSAGNSSSHLEGQGSIDQQDYMDLNGDGYPELVYPTATQRTNSTGGLGGLMPAYANGNLTNTDSYQNSVSISFSPNSHKTVGRTKINGNSITTTQADTSTAWSGTGLSANYDAKDVGESYWLDVNGDGLPDRITGGGTSNMRYALNMGNALATPESYANLQTYASRPVGSAGLSFSTGAFSQMADFNSGASSGFGISGSLSASASLGTAERVFEDINGDGLVDILNVSSSSTTVNYNLGNKFAAPVQLYKSGGGIDFNNEAKTYSGGFTLSGYYYYNIPIVFFFFVPVIYLKLGAEASANIGLSIAEVDKSFKDMNGDGFPDLVISKNDGFKVNYSNIGKTNKLKSVASIYNRMPLNKFVIDYKFTQPNYNDPHGRLVMSESRIINPDVNSGNYLITNPAKDMVTQFDYGTSRYDRRERDFFGFDTVTSKEMEGSSVYRSSRETFYNNSYFLNGILKKTEVFGGTSNLLSVNEKIYKLYKFKNNNTQLNPTPVADTFDTGGREGRKMATALLDNTKNIVYENGGSIQSTTQLTYNSKGQVVTYVYQSPSSPYHTVIDYHTGLARNMIDIPSKIDVYYGATGNSLLRHRETTVDNATGNIVKVNVKLNYYQNAVTSMKYDPFGNISQITYPPNEANEEYTLDYVYDHIQSKYLTSTSDSFGLTSATIYDQMFDTLIGSIDTAGNTISYQYDQRGRLISILAPNEQANGAPYTVSYEYFMSPFLAASNNEQRHLFGAVTRNYDPEHPQNPIETISIADGLGRVVQVKKDLEIDAEEKMSVSGMAIYDIHGRVVKQYHPVSEAKSTLAITDSNNPNAKLNLGLSGYYASTAYDALDRPIQQTDEDSHSTDTKFSITGGNLKTSVTQMQNTSVQLISESLKDAEGKIVQTSNYIGGQPLNTKYYYYPLDQLYMVEDAEGITTSYEYDLAGRRTRVNHPDHSTTKYEYDLAGNLVRLGTANLDGDPNISDPFIKYKYSYNRLMEIKFPPLANGYGNPSNVRYVYGAANSGNQTGRLIQKYDNTGDTIFKYGMLGEVIEENRSVYPYVSQAMNFVTKYTYDSWNRIKELRYPDGEKLMYEYDLGGNLKRISNDGGYEYVRNITYDQYEQRTFIDFGNDTNSSFEYLPTNRRLAFHSLKNNGGNEILANVYKYDFVGNITSMYNKAPKSSNEMGGPYQFKYSYDQLNRLRDSGGDFNSGGSPYAINKSNYELALAYNASSGIQQKTQRHTQDGAWNHDNTYDSSYNYIKGTHKIDTIYDSGGLSDSFEYDYNGNPVAHNDSKTGTEHMYWDEQDRLKAYYAPEKGTFQYYAYDDNSERIIKYNLKDQANLYQNGALISSGFSFDAYKLYPNAYISVGSNNQYTKHYYAGTQRIAGRIMEGTKKFVMDATPYRMKQDKKEEVKQVNPETDFKDYLTKAGLDINDITTELSMKTVSQPDVYYLHGDHLGTATFVTNSNSETIQFFLNLPFGETMAEQMTGVHDNPYKFNAKELDAETGLYYYGARYYNPKLSAWYGVDPLAEDYPSWSPYVYTLNNPIKYIDPDGKSVWPPAKGTEGQRLSDGDGDFIYTGGKWYRDNGAFIGAFTNRYDSVGGGGGSSSYDGKSMLPSSNYDYTYDIMPGKQADDIKYWKNGESGTMASRFLETTARDAIAKENRTTTIEMAATIFTTPRGGGARSSTGKYTEPQLPNKTIVDERGITVEHYYKSGDHAPTHFHVKGGGTSTKIGANGKPIKGSAELSKAQQTVIENNKSAIRSAGKKLNNYQKFHNYYKNK